MRLEDLPPKMQEQVKRKLDKCDSKYHAKPTEVDGVVFDSMKEASHYADLKFLERAGVITDLELQPRFLIQEPFICDGKKERKIEYVADFRYKRDGRVVVEDVKGKKTDVYKLKRKLFLYRYGDSVDFREV